MTGNDHVRSLEIVVEISEKSRVFRLNRAVLLVDDDLPEGLALRELLGTGHRLILLLVRVEMSA